MIGARDRPRLVTDRERRALEAIDSEGLVECLSELIAFRSLGGEESPIQERVAGLMSEFGLEVDRWPIDLEALRGHPAHTVEIERDEALGVVGALGEGDGATLILNGHVDVVPEGDPARWTVPAWRGTVSAGRVWGRGSADMKGGLCCALFAARAIREAGLELAGRLLIHSVVGEEDGGLGTLAAIERGHVGEAAIVLEPTGLVVAPAQAGALGFRLTVPGKAAHGALRAEGVDPLEKFLPLHAAMREFEDRLNREGADPLFSAYEIPYALCIGRVEAGIWASTVAESLICEGRLGVPVDADLGETRRAFAEAIGEAARSDPWLRAHPPILAWPGAQFGPAAIPADHELVRVLAGAHEAATGRRPEVRGVPYGADMRLLVNEGGVPTVIYGPGDVRRAHAPDEFVPIAELEAATRALALAALRFCGVRG